MLYKYIFWLFIYSVIGWIYETIICSIEEKRFVKRGFLNGCYCPVYGFGAVFDILFISWIENPICLFLAGMILTCVLEYLTSWILEVVFKARWWDYSYMKYHINGRICLLGAVVFGVFSVLLIKFIHPFVLNISNNIPEHYLKYISVFLIDVLVLDFIFTIIRLSKFNQKLYKIQRYINIGKFVRNIKPHIAYLENNVGNKSLKNKNLKNKNNKITYDLKNNILKNNLDKNNLKDKFKIFIGELTKHDKRLLKSFPKFNSTVYAEAIKKIREYLNNKNK